MLRRLSLLICLVLPILAAGPPAPAQSPEEVSSVVADRGYYVDPGLSLDEGRISAAVARAGNSGLRLMVVILDQDPSGGATTFAAAVLDRTGDGTVLVLSQTMVGMESLELDQGRVDRALDAVAETDSDVAAVEAAVEALVSDSGGGEAAGGGGGLGLILLVGIVGSLVLAAVVAVRRGGKAAEASKVRAVEEARTEIRAQLDAMANTILEISDKVSASQTKEDNRYLEQASQVFAEASAAFPAATDLVRLEALSGSLDEARWQLDAAAALADGKPPPPPPTPEDRPACFFDPTHSGPFEEAEVKTATGARKVRVCAADAGRLRGGEQPEPRLIEVGGKKVPAPSAPRSYGGGGIGWLDIFSVIVGGMGQPRSYDWGGARPRVGSGSRVGGFSWRGGGSRSSGGGPRMRVGGGRTRLRR
jgi:hypothetical protein